MRKFFVIVFILLCVSCSPKIIEHTQVEVEYRDRYIHDTTEVEIPHYIESIVTRDTSSHLENAYAKSDAVVSDGNLSHSLETKPQIIKVPFEVRVTDTLWRESSVATEIKEVEKELTPWQRFKMNAFWAFAFATIFLLLWTFRKFFTKFI